jgi:hypothetical protein
VICLPNKVIAVVPLHLVELEGKFPRSVDLVREQHHIAVLVLLPQTLCFPPVLAGRHFEVALSEVLTELRRTADRFAEALT